MSCTIIADSEVGFENRIIILFHNCVSQLHFLTVFHGCFNDCISWLYLTGQHTKTNALQCGLHHSIHHHGPHRHCHILQGGLSLWWSSSPWLWWPSPPPLWQYIQRQLIDEISAKPRCSAECDKSWGASAGEGKVLYFCIFLMIKSFTKSMLF